jgi:hypothetical protein
MRHSDRICLFFIALLLASPIARPAFAAVPIYADFELQARSNLCLNPNEGTFNLACDHFFTNGTPVVNNHGAWTVKLEVVGTTGGQGVLFGANASPTQVVYTTPSGAGVSDPWINNHGLIVFPQNFSTQNSLRQYDTIAQTGSLLTTLPVGADFRSSVVVNDNAEVGMRASFTGRNGWYSYASGSTVAHALEVTLDAGQPYTFLFSPHMNDQRQMAGRVSIGSQDQIRRINPDGSFTIIAVDRDTNPKSPYNSLDSSRPAIMDDGRVAFIASLFGGGRGVFLSDGTNTTTITTTLAGQGVSEIEFFPPHVNNRGQVVFRGRDASGLRAVFVGDGANVRRVIGEHDIVPSDNGPARIDQNDNSPVFGGAPTINDCGQIAFHCTLTPPDNNQIEWGSGIYIARPRAGDATGDGTVDVDDLIAVILGWGPCPPMPAACAADVDCNFTVDVDDLIVVILNWG